MSTENQTRPRITLSDTREREGYAGKSSSVGTEGSEVTLPSSQFDSGKLHSKAKQERQAANQSKSKKQRSLGLAVSDGSSYKGEAGKTSIQPSAPEAITHGAGMQLTECVPSFVKFHYWVGDTRTKCKNCGIMFIEWKKEAKP